MIEIEKKFILTPDLEKKLKKGAKYVGENIFTDTYFDNQDFELTINDIWLRLRDKSPELKMPKGKDEPNDFYCNRYEEFTDENEIRQMLNIAKSDIFLEDLITHGYRPFAEITTRRETFRKQNFRIDIDAMDFGYFVAEVELLVEKEEEMKQAESEISAFAARHGLELNSVRGKVLEYLYRKDPFHFGKLLEAGVVVE